MLNKNIEKKLEDIIHYITNSNEYKKCIEIKNKMSNNKEINELIEKVKLLQKKYIRENSPDIEKELILKKQKLNQIPIYVEYNNYLETINKMINLVKDELNDYFDALLNPKK